MRRIGNLWFKVSFVVGIVAFAVLNYRSYLVESARYTERLAGPIHFSHDGYAWGFPFVMYRDVTCFPCMYGINVGVDIIGFR